jgi:sarcosine oxidase
LNPLTTTADVVVIGLGAAGAATAWRLARLGVRVIGLDRHHPPHDRGSSHGESRITRQAIGEGDEYIPLALRAHDLWRQIQAESGETLMLTTGGLVIGALDAGTAHPGKEDFVRRTIDAAGRFAIAHEVISPEEAAVRFPQLRLRGDETVYFEPGAGVLFPERCVATQIALARRHGAVIRTGETVLAVRDVPDGVTVATDKGEYAAGQVVVAAGSWAGELLGGSETASRLMTFRQAMHWFEPDDPRLFTPDRFPVFIWMHGRAPGDWFYGFPILPGSSAIKLADERFDDRLSAPGAQSQVLDPKLAEMIFDRHIAGRIDGVTRRCVRSAACLYTMAPGSRFLVGRAPESQRVIVVSACSGHGFKHSVAIGDLVTELATEAAAPALLAPFALEADHRLAAAQR